jgi:hypothetical protein
VSYVESAVLVKAVFFSALEGANPEPFFSRGGCDDHRAARLLKTFSPVEKHFSALIRTPQSAKKSATTLPPAFISGAILKKHCLLEKYR